MRAAVLVICLLSAVVVGAAYYYRDSWYDGSWLESWVQRSPSARSPRDDTAPVDPAPTPAAVLPALPSSQGPGIDARPLAAESVAEHVASVLAGSSVLSPESGSSSTTAEDHRPASDPSRDGATSTPAMRRRDRQARLATEVTQAIKAHVEPTGTEPPRSQAEDRAMAAVAEVVGDAVGTALADTVPEDKAPALAETLANAVAEALIATTPGATEREVADAVAHAVEGVVVVEQAKHYIERISEPIVDPVAVEHADHFVTQDQVISLLPQASFEVTSRDALIRDPDLDLDTPITVVREVEQIEISTPEKVIANAAGELNRPVRLLVDDEIEELTVQQVLERYAGDTEQPIAVVKFARHYEITTPGELAEASALAPDQDQVLTIVKRPYRLESATIGELLNRKLEYHPDTVFYIRTVAEADVQGIWGIVLDSLVENFARGMRIRHGERVQTYRIEIPRDADELLTDRSSSYLGRMIHSKTMQSHVYNFVENRMGRNPDRIFPGQEIVIIDFQPEELIGIYRHFLAVQG